MFSYKSTIAYDGSLFFGWQKTRAGPTIQGNLEESLFRLTQERSLPEAASRTDRGVHAEGQVIAFSLEHHWESHRLQKGLNALLPPEIRILDMEETEKSFHPTLHACGKEYHYRICRSAVQNPIDRLYSWHFRPPLDRSKMEAAGKALLGTRDFSSFANEKEENPLCTLKEIALSELPGHRLQISLLGDRFLYKMARNLAGTLLYVGCGKLSLIDLPLIIDSKKRETSGVTAPAHGLFLKKVFYDKSE